jgi:hypothetical protein
MLKLVSIIVLVALSSPAGPARAQQPSAAGTEALRDFVTAKAGETVRIWTFFDCTEPRGAPTALGTAANGTITVRRAVELQCGNPEQPVAQVFYTPREGFSGEDDAALRGPRGQEVQIKLWVGQAVESAGPAAPARAAISPGAAAAAAGAGAVAAAPNAPRPPRIAERPSRGISAPARRGRTAAKPRSCGGRGQPAIVRLLRCELGGRVAGRKRMVRREADSAR